jgi:quercetin dioxygenase-like cupin family protein
VSKVRVHRAENVEWVTLRSLYPADLAAERSDAELDSTMAYHEQGTAGSLHLTEYKYLPNAKFDLHAHDQAEIIYVLEGTLLFGTRALGRGSSVFIAAHTLYEFAAGLEGLRMLVFMPDGRVKYFGKEDFLRLQESAPAAVA